MRLDRHGVEPQQPASFPNFPAAMPFGPFSPGPFGWLAPSQWAEVYRIARERTAESLRPTPYDRLMGAPTN